MKTVEIGLILLFAGQGLSPYAYGLPKSAPQTKVQLVVDPRQSIQTKKIEDKRSSKDSYEEMLKEIRKLYKKPSSQI